MDVVRWLSLVLFGFFWIGLIVVYELSLFDKELTSLLAQYARYDAAQSEAMPTVVLMTREQGWAQADRSDAAADFWMDAEGQQNQRVIKDSRPVLRQPESRFEKFSKTRYLSQRRKLATLGRLGSLLSRSTLQQIRRQKSQLEALKANYNGSQWKSGVRALDRLERTVFQELARINLIEADLKEMVFSADELLALVEKQPAMHRQFTRMFYSTKRMRVRAILAVLTRQRQQRQLRHLRRQARKQSASPLINSQHHMSEQASQHFRKHVKPELDDALLSEKHPHGQNAQYDYVSQDGSIKIKYLKSTSEDLTSRELKRKEPKSREMIAWLKNKYLAAAKQNKQDPSPREQEAWHENYDLEAERKAGDEPEVQEEQPEEEANSNYAYDLKVDVEDGTIKAVPASGFVDQEALHARMLEQRAREMQRKRKAHEEKLRAGESRDKSAEREKTDGFETVRTAKETLKDYDYDY